MYRKISIIALILIGATALSINHDFDFFPPGDLVPNGDFEDPVIPAMKNQLILKKNVNKAGKTSWYTTNGVFVIMRSKNTCPELSKASDSGDQNQVLAAM